MKKNLQCVYRNILFQYFGLFVDQHLKLFDELHNPADDQHHKPIREVRKPSLQVIGEKYFWVSSPSDIFLLNSGGNLAFKLSPEEITELPVEIAYVGQESPEYRVDEKRVFEIITSIILKMNMMQTSEVYSFPLG